MCRLLSILALVLVVAGCGGSVTPGDDSDPAGAYRFSHSRSYGQLMIPDRLAPSSRPV